MTTDGTVWSNQSSITMPARLCRLTTFSIQCIHRSTALFSKNARQPILYILEDSQIEGLLIAREPCHNLGKLDLSIKVDQL